MNDRLVLRPVRDADGPHLVELIGAAYAEYPGCVLDLPDLDADLPTPATTAAQRGGRWWVLVDGERIVASVGTGPLDDAGRVELKRLYVAGSHRRRGLASLLVDRVEAQAAGIGASHVLLWSDTRFLDAHRLYELQGYRDTGARRDLHDPSETTEICFEKPVESAEPRRTWRWDGPFGTELARWFDLPDGVVFRGVVTGGDAIDGPLRYVVEVDEQWRTRRAHVVDPEGSRTLTSDGAGRWWRDGRPAPELAGCLDVDLEASPVTNTLTIRRAGAGRAVAAWIRGPSSAVERLDQAYEPAGDGAWTYRSQGGFVGVLTVDDDGLVIEYRQRHEDGTGTPIWSRH